MDRWLKTGSLKNEVQSSVKEHPATSARDDESSEENYIGAGLLDESDPANVPEHNTEREADLLNLVPASSSTNCSETTTARKTGFKRKYHISYLDIGFSQTCDNKPQCVICGKVLPNSSMFPAKMRRHFEGVHPEYKNKPTDFFIRKHSELAHAQKTISYHSKTVNENVLKASYLVGYRVAKAGEAHTIAENLIKPCVKDIIECMLDDKAVKLVDKIPLSNNTISRRICDLAENVKNTLISRIKQNQFSLQIDESTDVAGLAILIAFVRYQYTEGFKEDLLFCKPLPFTTTGAEIFKLIDDFFNENDIPWNNCIDICTDGAKAMTGTISGVISRIKQKSVHCSSSHCVLHRHAVAMKKMQPSLKGVLDESVKVINFIKSRPKNTRLFKILCDDMGSLHTSLLLHSEIRWLSRGKTLTRLFELRAEVGMFLMENKFILGDRLLDEGWLTNLAYLADIFQKLNDFNLSLQGKSVTVFDARDKVESIKKKIKFWADMMKNRNLESFPALKEFRKELVSDIPDSSLYEFHLHLLSLLDSFNLYFPEEQHYKVKQNIWILQPYSAASQKPAGLTPQEYECLIDLTSNTTIKINFEKKNSLAEFWCQLNDEFKILSDKAKLFLLPFATTYLCESGFSAYVATKTKYRSRLNAEPDIRLQLSQIQPDIATLIMSKQAHPSH